MYPTDSVKRNVSALEYDLLAIRPDCVRARR
jgi:hypothetical protein